MTPSFKKVAGTWSEVYDLTQEYIAHVEKQPDQTVRIFGYGSLIFGHKNEKQGSELPNEDAVLKYAKVSLNLMAAGEGEYRGEYSSKRKSTGVYMGMEQSDKETDIASGKNITVELRKAKESLRFLYERELGKLPDGITYEDVFSKGNEHKFRDLPDDQNKLKLYKLATVETEIKETGDKVLSLVVPTNERSALAAVGRSAMEIAVMVAQGQGILRKKGESSVGGEAIDYFMNTLNNFRKNEINVPFMEEVNTALETYLKFSNSLHKSIRSGGFNSEKLSETLKESGADKYAYEAEDKTLPAEKYLNSGIASPFFHAGISDQLTKRTDFTKEEYEEGLTKIPHESKLAIERLAGLYQKHFGNNELKK